MVDLAVALGTNIAATLATKGAMWDYHLRGHVDFLGEFFLTEEARTHLVHFCLQLGLYLQYGQIFNSQEIHHLRVFSGLFQHKIFTIHRSLICALAVTDRPEIMSVPFYGLFRSSTPVGILLQVVRS